jgi:dolichol-phosphate mannosyltransferase
MLSIVVPVKNEAENILPLVTEIAALRERIPLRELVYVDDGSTDATYATLAALRNQYPFLKIVRHGRTAGQSAALWTGIRAAANELVATIDGDGQNDPADIERLYQCYLANKESAGQLMVMGQRLKRQDNWLRRISSRVANRVRAAILKDGTRDTGCSLKLFRREDYLALPCFDHMHRFLPALMLRQQVRVMHIDVSHRPRLYGSSKYGMWDRLWVGIADLAGVAWLRRRPFADIRISEE